MSTELAPHPHRSMWCRACRRKRCLYDEVELSPQQPYEDEAVTQ
jgi:hypothetical protein